MGANLIPMAESLPESTFVGIDLSGHQIEIGQQQIKRLGLSNIELREMSITDVDESLGKFDYIICHGVFSWVPENVRRAILEIGTRLLTPKGLSYVSYNTYPGWHLRGVIRDMMSYHVEHLPTPQEKVAQSRALLKFLSDYSQSHFKAYDALLKQEMENLSARGDYYIFHEHLEDINVPMYFHEFVKQADAAGLRYLADTSLTTMVAQTFDDSAAEILKSVPLLRREQYMDFLRSRAFRCSLLCHQNVTPDYSMSPERLMPLHVRLLTPGQSKPHPEIPGLTVWKFGNHEMSTSEPITTALGKLNETFPAWTSIAGLVEPVKDKELRGTLLECMQIGFVKGIFHLSCEPPEIAARPSERPECRKLIQVQAGEGPRITTLLHSDLMLQPQQRFLASLMDGSRSNEELADLLSSAVSEGKLGVSSNDGEVKALDHEACKKIVDLETTRMCQLSMLAS
jgi:methyltransferase-like protein/cyclopropane fatty-acyl-phospholipid synthase-like methyltransferase